MPIQRRIYSPGNWLFITYRAVKPYQPPQYTPPKENDETLTDSEWKAYHSAHMLISKWEKENPASIKSNARTAREATLEKLEAFTTETATQLFPDANHKKGLDKLIEEKNERLAYEIDTIKKIEAALYNSRIFKDMHDGGPNLLLKKGKLKYRNVNELFERMDSHLSFNQIDGLSITAFGWLSAGAGLAAIEGLQSYTTLSPLKFGIMIFWLGFGLYLVDQYIIKPIQTERIKEKITSALGTENGKERDLPDVFAEKAKYESICKGLADANLSLSMKQGDKGGLDEERLKRVESVTRLSATL